ncbi:MAG: TPM domain-containing protein [Bacteroidales bacterium]|nr:TPM domain-containing protein [Bacteroidales bacterium]
MRNRLTKLLALTVIFFTVNSGYIFAQDIPDRPNPPRLVNDFAGLLTANEINSLERKLVSFNDSTTTQIAIVIVKTLSGYDKSDYAQRLGEKWGIGQKGSNNGVLILVKPKTSDSNGEVFIAPGYGLEGVIPDITCGEIVDYEILPAFRIEDYFGGLNNATSTIMSLARGEFSAEQYGMSGRKSSGKGMPVGFIIFIIIIIIAVISGKKGGSNNKNISSGGLPLWLLLSMMNSGRGSHSGSWGGFSGGGSSGGGFGGFGGGSFGGGGAGGSW